MRAPVGPLPGCVSVALLLGFTAGEPRVAAYRWCVHSNYAINCRFQSQSACMAAASHRRLVRVDVSKRALQKDALRLRALYCSARSAIEMVRARAPLSVLTTSSDTSTSPDNPNARPAAGDKSMTRPRTNGPLSLTRTSATWPFRRLVTRIMVPNGSVRCAAVIASSRNGSPLAVDAPDDWSYTDAIPDELSERSAANTSEVTPTTAPMIRTCVRTHA